MKKSIPGFTVSTCLLVIPFFLVTIGNLQAQSPSRVTLEKLAVYPTLIVYNGKVGTMDNNLTTYQAMAIRGDRIWTLGTDREIRQLAGPQTQMIDLKGRTVVPGLIDVHTHPHLWAWWHYGGQVLPQLEPAYAHGKNFEEVRRNLELVIQQRIQKQGKDQWVMASIPQRMQGEMPRYPQHGRLFPDYNPGGRIRRTDLDRIAPDTPGGDSKRLLCQRCQYQGP